MSVRHTVGTAASHTLPAVGALVPSVMLHHRSVRAHERAAHSAPRAARAGTWDAVRIECGHRREM